jgi:hypothetical protein
VHVCKVAEHLAGFFAFKYF